MGPCPQVQLHLWRSGCRSGMMGFNSFTSNTDIELQNLKQAFRSDLILNVYAKHLRKVSGAAATYGEQYGALALCTAAVSLLLSTHLIIVITFSFTRPNAHLLFGHQERT
jgi:hypothetical protein